MEKPGCSSCKNKGLKKSHWLMIIISFYILFASIYGSIVLFKELMSKF